MPGAILGPYTRRQSVRRVVRLFDRLVGRAEREDGQYRTEDLLLRDAVRLRDVRENGRHEPVAAVGKPTGRLVDLGALFYARLHERRDLLELLLRVDRADIRVLVERIADAQGGHPSLERRDHRLVDRLLHEEARARAADMALIEVDPVDDSFHRLVERRVVEDDVPGLPAELERQPLPAAGAGPLAGLPHLGRTGERDLVDAGMGDELRAGAAVAGDDVHDAGRKLRLPEDVAEEQRR